MRKIEKEMLQAIETMRHPAKSSWNEYKWHKDNTMVESGFDQCDVYLHGNHIATIPHNGELQVNLDTLRRWPSMTTRSRLRALGADLVSIKGTLHLDGKSIYAE